VKCICIGSATALAFAVFGTATALAQPAKTEAEVEISSKGGLYVSVALPGDRQEEVEILRRLLDKGFEAVYGPLQMATWIDLDNSGAGWSMSSLPMANYTFVSTVHPATHLAHLEGVYLKDYGVVYTITLPPPPNQMSPGPSAGVVTRTPLSPWERTRKELRGEKIDDEGKGAVGSPSLSDVILKVLADNGKHFTRLAEGERITVAVTFRDDAANGIYHPQSPGASGMPMPGSGPASAPSGMSAPGGSFPPQGMGLSSSPGGQYRSGIPYSGSNPMTPSSPPSASEDDAAWLADVRNGLRLGDFHVKHQNYPAALVAYKNAQELLQKAFDKQKELSPEDAANVLTAAHLYLHLAKSYESADDNAAARKAMDKVGSLSKMAATLAGAESTVRAPRTTPAQLPSKLVVTASKKLLDEVGSGKMTVDAFRKAATVEYVKPPAADKK
jgi:hypothetical protein